MKSTRRGSNEPKVHNKSGTFSLSILQYTDKEINDFLSIVKETIHIDESHHHGLIEESPCFIINSKDGRITKNSKKVAWAYHVVAFFKFGRKLMETVASNKSQTDLVISHLCGSKLFCCNPDHLVLESKKINDERTHCHYCVRNILDKFQYDWDDARDRLGMFFEIGSCNHTPKCCTADIVPVDCLLNLCVHVKSSVTKLTIISTNDISD